MIGVIAAYKGMQVGGGAEGVGRAVNESVVTSPGRVFMVSVVYTTLFLAFYPGGELRRMSRPAAKADTEATAQGAVERPSPCRWSTPRRVLGFLCQGLSAIRARRQVRGRGAAPDGAARAGSVLVIVFITFIAGATCGIAGRRSRRRSAPGSRRRSSAPSARPARSCRSSSASSSPRRSAAASSPSSAPCASTRRSTRWSDGRPVDHLPGLDPDGRRRLICCRSPTCRRCGAAHGGAWLASFVRSSDGLPGHVGVRLLHGPRPHRHRLLADQGDGDLVLGDR